MDVDEFKRSRLADYLAALLAPGVGQGAVGAARGKEGNRALPALRAALAGITGYVGGSVIGTGLGMATGKPGMIRKLSLLGKLVGSAEMGRLGSQAHLVKDSSYVRGFRSECTRRGVDPSALLHR